MPSFAPHNHRPSFAPSSSGRLFCTPSSSTSAPSNLCGKSRNRAYYARPESNNNNIKSPISAASSPSSTSSGITLSYGFKRIFPTILTTGRILLTPVLAYFYLREYYLISSFLFALSSFTDLLDGYLARRWEVCSDLGAFLDPVADKLSVSTALVCCVTQLPTFTLTGCAIVIICREMFISALREWMAQREVSNIVSVGFLGKCKTAAQMLALTILLTNIAQYLPVGIAVLGVATVLSVASAAGYIKAALPVLLKDFIVPQVPPSPQTKSQ